jgi:hypothetical protein
METKTWVGCVCIGVLGMAACQAPADEAGLQKRLDHLQRMLLQQQQAIERQRQRITNQDRTIAEQQRWLEQQRQELQSLRNDIVPLGRLGESRGAGEPGPTRGSSQRVAQAPAQPVGTAPPPSRERRPQVQAIPELGGVLTPRGKLVLEPSIQFSTSQVNRLTFVGIEILEAFQIGLLEAQDADRDLIQVAFTARYGLTNRLELEAKLPYLYRRDRLTATIPSVQNQPQIVRNLDGSGIGDVEFAVHYQLNRGLDGWPVFIGNLRYKTTTGKGPFDVSRGADGLETELATGSGFQAIEPSITALFPSDPAVFFGSLGYQFQLQDTINKTYGTQTVGEVDPGDAIRLSFGMGYAINQRASFTLGYKHDYIRGTMTEINGVRLHSSSLQIGSLLLGYGYQLNERTAVNVNLELGITADAPDVLMTLRVPYTM